MSVLQKLVSSLPAPQYTAGKETSALSVVHFGVFEVNFSSRELRKNSLAVKLQEKPFQILEALLEKAGEVVKRDELRDKLWPDTFVGFDRCLNTAVSSLRQALGDSADNPRFIETRSRRGYRFVAPVRMWKGAAPRTPAAAGTPVDTIAVLPFDSSGGDVEMRLLSDTITESVITYLSRLSGVRVIGSSCVFRYRDPGTDPLAAGRNLNSRAVLTGWIARRLDTLTIGTELVDVAGGWRLWGEQYNFKPSDTFEVKSEISKTICEELRQRLTGPDMECLG